MHHLPSLQMKSIPKWRSYCIAQDMAPSQVEKIIFFLRCGIWNNAWSKNQTRSQNFEIQASNSLSNLACLALFKSASNWHQLWWSPWTGDHPQLSEAAGLQEWRRLHQSSQKPADGRRGQESVKTDVMHRKTPILQTGNFGPPALEHLV